MLVKLVAVNRAVVGSVVVPAEATKGGSMGADWEEEVSVMVGRMEGDVGLATSAGSGCSVEMVEMVVEMPEGTADLATTQRPHNKHQPNACPGRPRPI